MMRTYPNSYSLSPPRGEGRGEGWFNPQTPPKHDGVAVTNHPSPSIPLPVEGRGKSARRAFTLIEMLVVLVIIGILAALALPHIRGHSESVAITAATHQLVEDLSYARQKALSQRSTVAIVFLPADALTMNYNAGIFDSDEKKAVKRLQSGAYTQYAIYAFRRVGEQPGQPTAGYLTEWKTLPEKTFFGTNQFDFDLISKRRFPYPLSRSVNQQDLPYIAFDPEGRCITINSTTGAGTPTGDVDLQIARGAILYVRDAQGGVDAASFQLQEIPPFNAASNIVHIDAVTGRALRILPELK